MAAHEQKVERIVQKLAQHRSNGPLLLRKRSVSHQVPKSPSQKLPPSRKLDISDLDQILEINVEARTCTAEPGVTFERLVQATLPFGLVPIVVPELRTVTIGGAVSGCSIESTSFKYGGFHDCCLEYEVLTASGERLVCRPDNALRDVFQMMHGTFGTLGIITKLKFRLMPAKRFVKIEYEHCADLASYQEAIWKRFKAQSPDFVDGFVHSSRHSVLNVGRFVDEAPYTHRYDWLGVYCHSTRNRSEDYMTTEQYLFRYDRGVTNVHPRSFAGRLLLGPVLTSSRLLWLAERLDWLLPKERPNVTVDLFLPFSRMRRFLEWHERELDFYPLWVVPYRRVSDYAWLSPSFYRGLEDELFIDLAIYGMPQPPGRNVYRELELVLAELGGVKTLISHNFYSAQEFWSTWNQPNWQRVKARVDPANVFGDLYSKMCPVPAGEAGS